MKGRPEGCTLAWNHQEHTLNKKERPLNNEKYVGRDVHKATCLIVVKDLVGHVTMRSIVSTDAQALRDCFQSLRGTVHVALEEGTQSAWLFALLKPLVKTVVVCDARHNKTFGSGNKTDFGAAEQLAERLLGWAAGSS